MPTKIEKDAAAAGLSVEDYQAQLDAQKRNDAALSDSARAAEAEREKAATEAQEQLAKLQEQLAAAEEREAKAAAKVADLESRMVGVAGGVGIGAGTVTNNARGEVVTE